MVALKPLNKLFLDMLPKTKRWILAIYILRKNRGL